MASNANDDNSDGGGGDGGGGGNNNNRGNGVVRGPLAYNDDNLRLAVLEVLRIAMPEGGWVFDRYTGMPEGFPWRLVAAYFYSLGAKGSNKCRERYLNHLVPGLIPAGNWTSDEDRIILEGLILGKSWNDISKMILEQLGRRRSYISIRDR